MPEPRLGRNFRRLWASSTLTALGDGIRLVALPLLATRLTDDTSLIALVTVCTFLSALVFGPIAGVIVDATRPVAIIVTGHLIRAATLVILAATILTGAASIATLCVAAVVYGIAEAFADPATQTLIPRAVPRDSLSRANSDIQTGMIVGEMFLGRALGGVLFALATGLPLAVNAFLLLAATPFAIGIRVTNTPARDKIGTRVGRFFRQLREGITIVLDSRLLARMSILLAVWGAAAGSFWGIAAVYAATILDSGPSGFGIMLAIAAIGSLLGARLAVPFTRKFGGASSALVALILSSCAIAGLGLTNELWIASALLAINGFANTTWNVMSVTVRQANIPEHALGRVTSTYQVVARAAAPLGVAVAGVLALTIPVGAVFQIGAVTYGLVGTVMCVLLWRDLQATWPAGQRSAQLVPAQVVR
ncbi:MFS transporter [Microbacterium sp. NPDC076911]|uniref:MFS transporter n=1 Tax=Microbacterium sp. NPDC076911 TaxID=3154958 RepID=UPI0034163C09